MGRDENVKVFEDTKKLVKNNEMIKSAKAASVAGQKLIREYDDIKNLFEGEAAVAEDTKIVVSKKRSFEAAGAYKKTKVCVHNFASATNPGGGVVRGSSAQEECLCRCSTLYFCLNEQSMWDGFYGPHRDLHDPVYNADCIYTPDVLVFKSDTTLPELLHERDWMKVDVVTCAAPNLRAIPSNSMNPDAGDKPAKLSDKELLDIHIKRGRRILDIAKAADDEVVILGAFGCGAFQNPPEVVSEAYRRILPEYKGVFETIEFAVYCSPRDSGNYDTFKRKLG